jgi:hypothetical protein
VVFSVIDVARAHQIPHRRAYDFFNFLTAVGACEPIARGSHRWIGTGEVRVTLAKAYGDLEVDSCDKGILELFWAGQSPTLGALATKFALLFLYVGADVLSIRKIVRLLNNGVSDDRSAKSLERRLYLAVSCLEAVSVVVHTGKPAEYRLLMPRNGIVEAAMNRRKHHLHYVPDGSLDSLLNRYDGTFMARLYEERQEELARIVA